MSLEDKIAALSPERREVVEIFVDFIISRTKEKPEPKKPDFIPEVEPVAHEPPKSYIPKRPESGILNADKSGIILAAEKPLNADKRLDTIDFADINARFGHVKSGKKEKNIEEKTDKNLDWL